MEKHVSIISFTQKVIYLFVSLLFLTMATMPLLAAEPDSITKSAVVLDSRAEMRAFLVFKTPEILSNDGKLYAPIAPFGKNPKAIAEFQSSLPASSWADLGFDDTGWDRQVAPIEPQRPNSHFKNYNDRYSTAQISMIFTRAKFFVTDPAVAGKITLDLRYIGGVVVFLNGTEIARYQLPKDKVTMDTHAEAYPKDLHCEPDGTYLQHVKDNPEGFKKRYRNIKELKLPAALIKKGENILALQIVRSPINENATTVKHVPWGGMKRVYAMWSYVGLDDIKISCDNADAISSNATRPEGINIWNVKSYETIDIYSYGNDTKAVAPVAINTPRNGVFSGRLAVSSAAAITKLKVTVSSLTDKASGKTISESLIKTRYARPATKQNSWTPVDRFDGLVSEIPANIPVNDVKRKRGRDLSPRINNSGGAVASLWFTVHTPKDIPAGRYEGTITISADGLKETAVPLHVIVHEWTISDPKDFRTINLLCMSPESVARHYNVPVWSEKHLNLMSGSLELMAQINSKQMDMNMSVNFYGPNDSNRETMVRWVKQEDGSYKYDFTSFDKYCDLIAKYYGKPLPLRLNCWGEYDAKKKVNTAVFDVSELNPADGSSTNLEQPLYGSEESYLFWKPVMDKVLERLKKREWLDVTAFGHNSYCYSPAAGMVTVAKRLWPEGVWAYTAHNGTANSVCTGTNKETMPMQYTSCVWTVGKLEPRGYRRLFDKKRHTIWNYGARSQHYGSSSLSVFRNLPEEMLLRGHNGMSDFGADTFPVPHPTRKGYYMYLSAGRGTGGGGKNSTRALLAPGPNGVIATERYESFREGTQLSEAILFLESALRDNTIPSDLATRINTYLDARSESYRTFWLSMGKLHKGAWSIQSLIELDNKLLSLASEVAQQQKK